MESTGGLAPGYGCVSGPGCRIGPFEIEGDHGVDARVVSIDPGRQVVENLDAGDGAGAQATNHCSGRGDVEIHLQKLLLRQMLRSGDARPARRWVEDPAHRPTGTHPRYGTSGG